jgi:single-stranded DNA-binding protein
MLNKVLLLAAVGDHGVTVRPLPESGALQAQFTLVCTESGVDGTLYHTYVPCEAYGKAREQAEQLAPGMLVCADGKLKRRPRTTKGGETYYETVVLCWALTPVQQAAALAEEG